MPGYVAYENNGRYASQAPASPRADDPPRVFRENRAIFVVAEGSRAIFNHASNGLHIDIFYDKLDFCHVISLGGRLEADSPTVPLAKMQIVKISQNDIHRFDGAPARTSAWRDRSGGHECRPDRKIMRRGLGVVAYRYDESRQSPPRDRGRSPLRRQAEGTDHRPAGYPTGTHRSRTQIARVAPARIGGRSNQMVQGR